MWLARGTASTRIRCARCGEPNEENPLGSITWKVMEGGSERGETSKITKLTDTPESGVVPGRERRPPAGRGKTRAVLIVAIVSTLAALGTFALIATRAVDSDNTRTDANAQRP